VSTVQNRYESLRFIDKQILSGKMRLFWKIYSLLMWFFKGLMANFCAAKVERPKFKTLEFQDKLPKLPVAPLHKSIEKYLKTVRPLVNDKEFEHTKR
jgi:hypothetical protein